MKKKQTELLRYLSGQSHPIKSTELANALQISSRSVKNYVSDINFLYNKKIILSSRQGYQLNHQLSYHLLLDENEEKLPQTGEERAFYIIKSLILGHTPQLDLFDLCDYLCISYSTLNTVITKMNKSFSAYHVSFICKNDCLKIIGSEKDKRRLISYIISEESQNRFIDMQQLEECFRESIPVRELRDIILSLFRKHNYYLNDFAALNLLLQLCIIIDRNINGNVLNHMETNLPEITKAESLLVQELLEQLEIRFPIHLNASEQQEIYMLFKVNANSSVPTSREDLKKYVTDKLLTLTDYYVEQVNNHYLVNLSDERFTTAFTLHLENLLLRAQTGNYTKNPMAESIKLNNPLIYDIAIYIGLDLMERFHILIPEDEIAFLAIHIGAELERQNTTRSKIRTALLCPDYRTLSNELLNKLLLNFGNWLDIICSVCDEAELKEQSFSLLLTTIPLKKAWECDVILLSPFNLNAQYDIIYEAITKKQDHDKNERLKKNFHTFFEADLFETNAEFSHRDDILHCLCQKLLQKDYVNQDFENNVMKRETAATTAFGNVAIPHSADMDAVKTSIAVAISRKGFQWGSNTVHIVFLLAINKADKQAFRDLYESLISLFTDATMIQEIRSCENFSDFEHLIYSHIGISE